MKEGLEQWVLKPIWYKSDQNEWKCGHIKNVYESAREIEWTFDIITNAGDICTVTSTKENDEFLFIKQRDNSESLSFDGLSDLTHLAYLNEPEILRCVENRFMKKLIYTNSGPILIAVNPFEKIDIYRNEVMRNYCVNSILELKSFVPHIYKLSSLAYQQMFVDKFDPTKRESQTILINGESGSGKTESMKHILRYLSYQSAQIIEKQDLDSTCLNINDLIDASNPITESFGNAKTIRNNNSSRFGKFIELNYTADGIITVATIHTYLLETVRVTRQCTAERNYHVFYELFAGLDAKLKEQWGMTSPKDFCFLNQSGEFHRHDGEDDCANYKHLYAALKKIGYDEAKIKDIFGIVVAILHIGNIKFQESNSCGDETAVFHSDSMSHVNHACYLLGIDSNSFLNALTKRQVTVGVNTIEKSLNTIASLASRDSYAKMLYGNLFLLLIKQINESLHPDSVEDLCSSVAVLDIFGFEHFQSNTFEQLCINFANEKLQEHFNFSIFKSERELYYEEGIYWNATSVPDNSLRLELFENKVWGIFSICDEQLKLPKPTDEKLAAAMYTKLDGKQFFTFTKSDKGNLLFTLNHYACAVKYSIATFSEKNKNELPIEILMSFQKSTKDFVKLLNLENKVSDKSVKSVMKRQASFHKGVAVAKKTSTLSSQFSTQLNSLILKIRNTRSHFVRCIKSNQALKPAVFESNIVLQQLICGGVIGAVSVFKSGFPNRVHFKSFVTKYSRILSVCGSCILTTDAFNTIIKARLTDDDNLWKVSAILLASVVHYVEYIINIIENVSSPTNFSLSYGMQLGKSMVFLSTSAFDYLETLQARVMNLFVRHVQRLYRARRLSKTVGKGTQNIGATFALLYFSNHKRKQAIQVITASVIIQRRTRIFLEIRRRKKMLKRIIVLQSCCRGFKGRKLFKLLREKTIKRHQMATLIQSRFRNYRDKNLFRLKCHYILLFQRMCRGFLARRKRKQLKSSSRLICRFLRSALIEISRRKAMLEATTAVQPIADIIEIVPIADITYVSKIRQLEDQISTLKTLTEKMQSENATLRSENLSLVARLDEMSQTNKRERENLLDRYAENMAPLLSLKSSVSAFGEENEERHNSELEQIARHLEIILNKLVKYEHLRLQYGPKYVSAKNELETMQSKQTMFKTNIKKIKDSQRITGIQISALKEYTQHNDGVDQANSYNLNQLVARQARLDESLNDHQASLTQISRAIDDKMKITDDLLKKQNAYSLAAQLAEVYSDLNKIKSHLLKHVALSEKPDLMNSNLFEDQSSDDENIMNAESGKKKKKKKFAKSCHMM